MSNVKSPRNDHFTHSDGVLWLIGCLPCDSKSDIIFASVLFSASSLGNNHFTAFDMLSFLAHLFGMQLMG